MANSKTRKDYLAELESLLENYGTAHILTSPSTADNELAKEVMSSIDMMPVMRDLAILAADNVADLLIAKGVRPADFVEKEVIGKGILSALRKAFSGKGSEYFMEVFSDHLRKG